jgi:hypothetical protein
MTTFHIALVASRTRRTRGFTEAAQFFKILIAARVPLPSTLPSSDYKRSRVIPHWALQDKVRSASARGRRGGLAVVRAMAEKANESG